MSIASASALVPTRVDAPSRARVHRRARANVVVVARASSTQDDDGADLSRRGLLSSGEWARMSQAPISTRHVHPSLVADLPRLSLSLFVRSRDGRRDGRRDTPRSHRRALRRPKRVRRERHGPSHSSRAPQPRSSFPTRCRHGSSKGCWQLSGGHRGDPSSDRTSGAAAVDDFASFVNAGIDTFDTGPEACGYGPSELIIGEALKSGKISRDGESILFYVRTGN